MSKIKLYTKDNTIEDEDKVIGTDASGENTKNYEMSAIRSYVGSTSVVTKKVNITPEQLLSLSGGDSSLELIPAPGAGKVIVPISIVSFLDFGTTPYNFDGALQIGFSSKLLTSGPYFAYFYANTINATEDKYMTGYPNITVTTSELLSANESLVIKNVDSATVTQGDSPLTLSITYRIVDFS